MTGTYRLVLSYVQDGHYGRSSNVRKALAKHKRQDRRIKRRQERKATSKALALYHADGADDLYDWMMRDLEDNWYDDQDMDYDEYYSRNEEPLEDDYFDPYDYYMDQEDYYYYSRPVLEIHETSMYVDRKITPEDAGKSLGDLLNDALLARG